MFTISRLLPLHLHGAFEVVLALVLMAAPFAFGLEAAVTLVSLSLGGLILAVALATHAGERSALPISTHVAFDLAFAIALGAGAVAFALIGSTGSALLLSAGSISLVLLVALTRFSPNTHRSA